MNLLLSLFTQKEIMIILTVIGSLIALVIILTIWDLFSKKKKDDEDLEINLNDQEITLSKNVLEDKKVETVKEELEPTYLKEELNHQELEPINLKNISEEVQSIEVNEVNFKTQEVKDPLIMEIGELEIDNLDKEEKAKQKLLRIEEELENPKSLEDTITSLEKIEEENAIISYQELLENTREMSLVDADSGDEPISIKEVFSLYEDDKELESPVTDNAYKADFTSSPYISPVMGFENGEIPLAEIQLENTANLEKLEKEIRKTNEFLTILNELKKNLD